MKILLYRFSLLLFFCSFYSFSLTHYSNASISLITSDDFFIKEDKDKEIATNGYQIKTIVLDAGHGGKDAGCSGKHSQEKHIALNVVLKLGNAIEQQYPSIKVIYTRQTDVFIPLYKRAAIANKNNADLFISIHCNALSHKAHLVNGSETYVMGLHTAEHNLEVARRENESILLDDDYQKNYQGFDPNSDEGHIFLSMFQNAFLDKSIQFAEKVESKIKVRAQRKSRGVKQAGFVVLKETTMPSVLIETGYLTNASEEAFLRTNQGQNKMANAIFEAFVDYKMEVEDYSINPMATMVTPPATTENHQYTKANNIPQTYKPAKSTPTKAKAIPTSLVIANHTPVKEISNPIPPAKEKISLPSPTTNIIYKIQLAASPSELSTSNQKWSNIPYVEVRKEKSLYKYLTGSHTVYEMAVKNRTEVLTKGFNGAFIVAYKDGVRIPLKEARMNGQ